MNREASPERGLRAAALLGPILVSAGTLTLYARYTLPAPYFLDTVGYLQWIHDYLRTGNFVHAYRMADCLLYLAPVRLFGDIGIKYTTVALITLLAGVYTLLLGRDFSRRVALPAAILFLTVPATVIGTTHLKEDCGATLCVALSLLALRPRPGAVRALLAGIAYGSALLVKEIPVVLAPVMAGYVYVRCNDDLSGWREMLQPARLRRALPAWIWFAVGAVAIVALVAPDIWREFLVMAKSPYRGEFLGPFSSKQVLGYRFWKEGILYLHPWYAIAIFSVASAVRSRRFDRLLYAIAFAILFVVLSNDTVTQMRHYSPAVFFLAPLIVDGLFVAGAAVWRASSRLGAGVGGHETAAARVLVVAVWSGAVAVAALQLRFVLPTLEYRVAYNPQQGFYSQLAKHLPADGLLLGMDSCPIAQYYSGLECLTHAADLDAAGYARFAQRVRREKETRPVFLIPDFFSYDARGVVAERFPRDFRLQKILSGFGEDYHPMTYAPTVAQAQEQIRHRLPDCPCEEAARKPLALARQVEAEFVLYSCTCRDRTVQLDAVEYEGHTLHLERQYIYAVR